MSKERLFELIRKEDVVLFVGAGFSKYAGYPTGGGLAKFIYNQLPKEDREHISLDYNLPKLCDDIFQLKGKNKEFLIECLEEKFLKDPVKNEIHLELSQIPHFKTIITTNYDTLFEDSYEDLEVIKRSKDLATIDNKKTRLFKIHGDLSIPEKLILTESDYEDYFIKNDQDSVFWNAVRTSLAEYHVLFIGYSLADSNIKTIIKKIYAELEDSKREAFLIAPDLGKVNQAFLQGLNINYINSTGEKLVKDLSEYLKETYIPFAQKNKGNLDTIAAYGESHHIKFELSKNDGKAQIGNFKPLKRTELKQTIRFSIGPEGFAKFDKFRNSLDQKLTFSVEEFVEFSFYLNNLKINDKQGIKEFSLIKPARYKGSVVLVFEDGFETAEFSIVIRSAKPDKNKRTLKIILFGFSMVINFEWFPKTNQISTRTSIKPKKLIPTVKDGIEFYEAALRIVNGVKFCVFENTNIIYRHKLDNTSINIKEGNFENMLCYFKDLKKIEKHFKIRFADIDLKNMDSNKTRNVLAYIDRKFLPIKLRSYKAEITDKSLIKRILKKEKEATLEFKASSENKHEIELHGQQLTIGYLLEFIPDGVVQNAKELANGKTNEILIKSKKGISYRCYADDKRLKLNEFKNIN